MSMIRRGLPGGAAALLVSVVAAFVLCFVAPSTAAEPPVRPNIVLLVADDLGYADLSMHGCQDIATPHIDALAKQGVRCTNGYVSCPYCSPTRAGLLTGRYQQRFGYEFNPQLLSLGGKGQGLPVGETTLPQRLKEAGYATALLGKWHLGEEEQFHPLNRGFGEFFGFLQGAHSYLKSNDETRGPIFRGRDQVELEGYLTDVLAKEAVAFIDRQQQKPFFLCLTFNAVHTPLQAPDALLKKFAAIEDPTRRTYAAMTTALDDAVGVVLDKLRTAKLDERTLVLFISDNGGPINKFAHNGARNAPLRGSKGDTWEGGIRVPFLARWTGKLPAGKVYDAPVIQLDLHATTLAAAGIPIKPEWKLDGVNLLPHWDGQEKAAPQRALYWRFGEQLAIRQGDWKLVRADLATDQQFGNVAKKAMLFNLASDIGERQDLADAQPDKVKELSALWEQWNRELAPPAWQHHSLQKPVK